MVQTKNIKTSYFWLKSHQLRMITMIILPSCVHAYSLQLCPTLWDPMDCSLPGSSIHGILQARILEWVAMPSSRGSSQPRVETMSLLVSCIGRHVLYQQRHLGSPWESLPWLGIEPGQWWPESQILTTRSPGNRKSHFILMGNPD